MAASFPCALVILALVFLAKSDESCDIDIENTLRRLLSPDEYPTIQLQALRRDMIRKLQEALDRLEQEEELNYKRSLSSLVQWNNLPDKRNLEALARAGYIKSINESEEEGEDDENDMKRSIANLARTGQLPSIQYTGGKRGIQSLARNGELHHKREPQQRFVEDYLEKKNIASLARNYNYPSSYEKRFIGSLARSGDLARFYNSEKRNIASLAREGFLAKGKRDVPSLSQQDTNQLHSETPDSNSADKRNIASIKAQYKPKFKRSLFNEARTKRQADYYYDDESDEFRSPVFQNQNAYDYDEFLKDLAGRYPEVDKRFLGSVARSGWFRSPSSSSRYRSPDKRHIGALARLGWLPSFRSTRRFNRSGRSTAYDSSCRETADDGQSEDNSIPQDTTLEDNKRFLLQPAVDKILLRKIFIHPRSH